MSLNTLTVGEGPPLLLLHGFTGTARTWSSTIDAWSSSRRVIAPDLLGHGGSEAPTNPEAYGLGQQASELARLMALLDAEPATVVGYSMGARLALVLALEHPHVVDRLVLESPSAGIADPTARAARRDADEHLALEIERGGVEAFIDRWEALPLFSSYASLPPEVWASVRAERLRHTTTGLSASLRGAGQGAMNPLHDRLHEISVPTLVVGGALDPTGLERARSVAGAIPGAHFAIVDGAGHTPHLEASDTFIRIANDHLSASPARA